MARICVASHHGGLGESLADAGFVALAARPEFLLELRLDQYRDLSVRNLTGAIGQLGPKALVVTFRSPAEGGRNPGAEDPERLHYLGVAASLRVAYVDLELETLRRNPSVWRDLHAAPPSDRPEFLVSFHDFAGTPPLARLRELRRQAEEAGADVVKLAVTAPTVFETLPLLELLRETGWRRPLLGLAMGEAGLWTRVLGPLFPTPAPFTFARAGGAPGTAPGQLDARELAQLYRFPQLRPGDPVYAVIGDPIAHSLSPLMHNTALAQAGLRGVLLPFRVQGDPARFVREVAPKLDLRGISVTIPHKEAVLAACAECDPRARQIGAANTLVRRPGGCPESRREPAARDTAAAPEWLAANTDAQAAAGSLEAALGGPGVLRGRRVLVLGAGGAARAVAFGLKALGAEVLIWNRTPQRAEILAREVGARSVKREELARPAGEITAVVNTTPVGMYPRVDESPLDQDEIPGGSLVFDTVYNPLRTKLLRLAEAGGHRTLEGVAMFVAQGAAQFELFTGRPAPKAIMERVVRAALAQGQAV